MKFSSFIISEMNARIEVLESNNLNPKEDPSTPESGKRKLSIFEEE